MFLDKKYQGFYQNYRGYLTEQAAVVSQDLNERLKGYLSDERLLTKLAEILKRFSDGEHELQDLDKTEFGINSEDRLFVKVDKSDKKNPKFFMWIMNEQFLWGDLDFDTAASILKSGGEGTDWSERGLIGSIGSVLGGNSSRDAGTNEETIAGLAGAIAQIAVEKGVDPQMYFDKLEEVFSSKYGTSIKKFLEEEFGGYGEIVSCNVYRREISADTMRGINFWTIGGDIILALSGIGGVAKGLAKSANATAKVVKYSKGASKVTASTGRFTKLKNLWNTSSAAVKLKRLEKVYAVGTPIEYISKSGKTIPGVVSGYIKGSTGAKMVIKTPTGSKFEVLIANITTKNAGMPGFISKASMRKLVPSAAAVSAGSRLDSAGPAEGFAEIMGWYDTLAADPTSFIENAKQQSASDIASMLFDLKNGSGLFGNTTDQEECAIALIITGLTPDMAKEVDSAYKKLDVRDSINDVLEDELGGDISVLTRAYWTGCTGQGEDFKPIIAKIIERIKKKD